MAMVMLWRMPAVADDTAGYRLPPGAIADLVDAPPTPSVSISPDRRWMLIMPRTSLPMIEELSQPELRLAGLRINPTTNGTSRGSHFTQLTIRDIVDGSDRDVTGLAPGTRIGFPRWSPDNQRIAFPITLDDGIELWIADLETARARKLTDGLLNYTFGGAFNWARDGQSLLARFVPPERGDPPGAPTVPPGPNVLENIGREAPARTYQDLLKSPHDEALFDYYCTSQIARVALDGTTTPLGTAGLRTRMSHSPDGRFILVETIQRPYSYLVPSSRFPKRVEVWNRDGEVVQQIADIPLAEEVPIAFGSVRTGPRSLNWRADAPATLVWAEALDGGDARVETDERDRVLMLPAPFSDLPIEIATLGLRFSGVTWGSDELALVSSSWRRTRRTRTWIVKPGIPDAPQQVLFDRSSEDRYGDPGSPLLRRNQYGESVLRTGDDGNTLFLSGSGASPEGDRPFLDRLDLTTTKTERLWRSEAPYYESVVDFLSDDLRRVVTRRESKTVPANYFIRDLDDGELTRLTDFPHPMPQFKDVQLELIRYERSDGVALTAKLYLPPGYNAEDGPLPMLMWAYPREFKSAQAAGQLTGSPHRFVRVSLHSALLWLLEGYAVLDGPTMPIVGEGDEEPNDHFIEQLVSSASAAIDEVVRRGVADPERIAIGGHSYGAFMTANLLAHSDLFRAGIARSGAYNRTLTPFGFQAEQRTLWESPDTYFTMSPFMHAEKVNEPILLIHGEADNNSGTFPLQSQRYYAALKGHGATARLVMLPHESHGYRARESVMHMLWEMTTWLDTYVKNASPR